MDTAADEREQDMKASVEGRLASPRVKPAEEDRNQRNEGRKGERMRVSTMMKQVAQTTAGERREDQVEVGRVVRDDRGDPSP